MRQLLPLNEHAWLARFDDEPTAARWAARVRSLAIEGIRDVVLAYRSVGVHADPDGFDFDELARRLATIEPASDVSDEGRLIEIPVCYDGADLSWVAEALKLPVESVIEEHSGREYRVFAVGFLPGFPYAGYLSDALAGLPRRASPRTAVPAGSVAIVGRQTAIYPTASPGGWHLIGRTPLRIVDLSAGVFPIRAGDRLRFRLIGNEEYEARLGERLA